MGERQEYRGRSFPAWAVRIGDAEAATVHVAAELHPVARTRNDRCRAFDFLWIRQAMHFQGRDDFKKLALRTFYVLGLVTVLPGFRLFALPTPQMRARLRRRTTR